MKLIFKLSLYTLLILSAVTGQSQIVKSPAKVLNAQVSGIDITINYNAPSVRERVVWGDLVPYEKVWRTGANSATKISVDKDILIEGQALPAGSYSIFTIPGKKTWTLIFNSDSDQWGAYDYDEDKDVLRLKVAPVTLNHITEQMTFIKANDSTIQLVWDNLAIPINFGPLY